MGKIEHKIKKVFLGLFLAGTGVLIAVSAMTLNSLKKTAADTRTAMTEQAVEDSAKLLETEINAQTGKYAACFGELMESRLLTTQQVLVMVADNIKQLYDNPDHYPDIQVPWGKELTGEENMLHWLLPDGMTTDGSIGTELALLGNAGPAFQKFTEENAQLLRIYYTSDTGINIGYDGDYEKKSDTFEGRETAWYQKAVEQGSPVLSDAYLDSFVQKLTVTYSIPIQDAQGKLRGVLAADLLIDDLEQMITQINLEFKGYAMLVSHEGRMVAADGLTPENAEDLNCFLGTRSKEAMKAIKEQAHGTLVSTIGKKEKYLFFEDVHPAEWSLVIVLDKKEMEDTAVKNAAALRNIEKDTAKKVTEQMVLTGLFWAVAAASVLLFGYIRSGRMAGRISAPIVKLCSEVKRIGTGELHYEHHIHTGDEVEELSLAFSGMTDSLKEYISNLSSLTADKERIETELGVANQIQSSMLPCIFPAFPEREEMDIFAAMEPAKEVGGDFYDFFLADEDHLCMVIADVSGKGIPAALFMVVSKTLIKDNVLAGRPLAEVFGRVNTQLCENNDAEMFVTAFVSVLQLSTGRLTYVNAGHNPPVIRRTDGTLEELKAPSGFVLAGMDGMTYQEGETKLSKGELFFAFTDGVTEAMDKDGNLYGEKRLLSYINANWNDEVTAAAMVWSVREDMKKFTREAVQSDDITMLGLKYRGNLPKACIMVEADTEELFRVREFIGRRLSEAGCPDRTLNQIQVAAEEIFVNISHYAYDETGSVEVTCAIIRGMAQIAFADWGAPYNPLERPDPDVTLSAAERPVGGLGIYLVKESVDHVKYEYRDGKNILTIAKII